MPFGATGRSPGHSRHVAMVLPRAPTGLLSASRHPSTSLDFNVSPEALPSRRNSTRWGLSLRLSHYDFSNGNSPPHPCSTCPQVAWDLSPWTLTSCPLPLHCALVPCAPGLLSRGQQRGGLVPVGTSHSCLHSRAFALGCQSPVNFQQEHSRHGRHRLLRGHLQNPHPARIPSLGILLHCGLLASSRACTHFLRFFCLLFSFSLPSDWSPVRAGGLLPPAEGPGAQEALNCMDWTTSCMA